MQTASVPPQVAASWRCQAARLCRKCRPRRPWRDDLRPRCEALDRELAAQAGVEITTEVVGSEDFDWGEERWDLILFSYVSLRAEIDAVRKALAPGGLILVEAFHGDATRQTSIGRGGVWHTNELLDIFSDFRILHYEGTRAVADFGRHETPVVRLLARKPGDEQAPRVRSPAHAAGRPGDLRHTGGLPGLTGSRRGLGRPPPRPGSGDGPRPPVARTPQPPSRSWHSTVPANDSSPLPLTPLPTP